MRPLSFVGIVVLLTFCCGTGFTADKTIVLGLASHDAAAYNTEFFLYRRMVPLFTENGIEASLIEGSAFYARDWKDEQLDTLLNGCHVVVMNTTNEGIVQLTPELQARARRVGAALARYVQGGGGLFLQPQPVRYANTDDEKYWNLVLEPLGIKLLHEAVFDKTRGYEGKTIGKTLFWYTTNMHPHPITDGVKSLYLPLNGAGDYPGVVAMQYSPDWQVLVRGEQEARSYKSGDDNAVNLNADGTYTGAPPVLAARRMGQGRIVCYPISGLFTGMNYGNPLWSQTVETAGDPAANRPSQGMKLQINCYKWLAEPALRNPALGTLQRPPYQPVQFEKSIDRDKDVFAGPNNGVRGIFGAHTAYSDGKGTVADYVKAAKDAGLSFIVFNDPLEKLTADKLQQLKDDCAAASTNDFYACPGIEFTDGIGNRWAFWGEKILFPLASFQEGAKTYTQWDGKVVHHYGHYASICAFSGSALLDYKKLRANGAHPENLWWFFHYLPLVYDNDRLVADNQADYLFGLRDLRWVGLASFTRILNPAEVKAAPAVTAFASLSHAKRGLNTRCAPGVRAQYVTQGPVIALWQNLGPSGHILYTRGVQRVRLKFVVRSDTGIAEVIVHDADQGAFRRFAGNGAKELRREFEAVNDKQHYLTLEVRDINGKRAFSSDIRLYQYTRGLYRCGDNLNLLCSANLVWHPDRNEMMQLFRNFANGNEFALRGWDTGAPLAPMPKVRSCETVSLKGIGNYPTQPKNQPWPLMNTAVSKRMDVPLGSTQLQICTMRMDRVAESWGSDQRPSPAMASLPRDVGDLEYFERIHTIYSPWDRLDYSIIWSARREREGRKDYRGGVMWHEGEIRFKKDCILQGAVPIPLVQMMCPTDLERGWGNLLIVTDAGGQTKVSVLQDLTKRVVTQGRIRPGGFACQQPAVVGYQAFLAPGDMDFAYVSSMPGEMQIGLGRDGQQVKAGTVMKYRFAIATFAGAEPGSAVPSDAVAGFNMDGGKQGYPMVMKAGEIADTTFFFTARAVDDEAAFTLGPRSLLIDLPIRVQGLEDNGCAAVYSNKRPWYRYVPVVKDTAYFQESIDQANDLWVGNVFVAENKALKITLVVDGQTDGKPPFVEVHNPTEKEITTALRSPAHAPLFGGLTATVKIPAGDSARYTIKGKMLEPWSNQ
ncbi:MAG: CehA/McbA family metallohydrolase domain-containing protein [Armatimonadota bacterium]